jgi:hypothetical protein
MEALDRLIQRPVSVDNIGAPVRLIGASDRLMGAELLFGPSDKPKVTDPKPKDPINIYIVASGMKEEYKLGRPYIVYSLMRLIENRQGIPTDLQTLLYESVTLKEFSTLQDYDISPGAEITLVVEAVGFRRIWNWAHRKLASTIRLVAVCWRPVHEKEKLSPKL